MHRKLWLWLVFAASPVPLFLNCHRATDLRFAQVDSASLQSDSDPQSEDHLVHTFDPSQENSPHGSKVNLDPSTLQFGTTNGAGSSIAAKAASDQETVIPSGLRLFALVDNDCLAEKRATLGSSKAALESLSEKVNRHSSGQIEDLKIQAYSFENPSDVALNELVKEANDDDCVLRVANDQKTRVLPPGTRASAQSEVSPADVSTAKISPDRGTSIAMATNDPGLTSQKHLSAIKATSGWNVFYSPSRGISKSVVIAVVDSGTAYSHEDLKANMWMSSTGTYGRDFENNDFDPMDDNGHGTHVAGLIGAVASNGIGVTGVMGRNAKIMAVKVTDSEGSAYPSTILNGVRWAADNGAEIINMSLGFPGANNDLRDAVIYAASKGAVVVIAAGNDGKLLNSSSYSAPANYASSVPGAIAVGATDSETGLRSSFSNYSNDLIHISAPGANGIWSTVPGGYQEMQGTSMATPIVSGAAGLIIGLVKSQGSSIPNSDVINVLKLTARANSDLNSFFRGGAALDLDRLGRYMKARYLIETDGGTESPF